MDKIVKDKLIQDELARFKKIYKDIDSNKSELCKRLFEEAAYLYATMQECKEHLEQEGLIEVYQNGMNQSGLKQNPASKLYLDCSKHYNNTIKQINECVAIKEEENKNSKKEEDNPIKAFAAMLNKGE